MPYIITIPVGETSILFEVADNTSVNSRNFVLKIDPSSLPNGVTTGDPSEATVVVKNDDGEFTKLCRLYMYILVDF